MEMFFSKIYGEYFVPFGLLHIFLLIITFIPIILIYIYQDSLTNKPINKHLPKIFATILLVNQIIFYVGYLLAGNFELSKDLPLHYCYITGYLYIYMLYFNKTKMFSWLYYSVFMCTLASIIWMDIGNSYDRYIFYKFFIAHSGLFVINWYCFFVLKFPVNNKGPIYAWLYSHLVFIIMHLYNLRFDTNYVLSKQLPDFVYQTYPFVKNFDYPIFWLEIVGLIIIYIAYRVVQLNKGK